MTGARKNKPNSTEKVATRSPSPDSRVAKPKATPKPESTTSSKSDANNGAVLSSNGFYSDEEAWIEIYFHLLAQALSRDPDFLPPPLTEILLEFNIFFQGYKEPTGADMPHANATAVRPRKLYTDFLAYVTKNISKDIIKQLRSLETRSHDANTAHHFHPFITPSLLSTVTTGRRPLTSLTPLDASHDTRPWLEKATTRLASRGTEIAVHWESSSRHADRHVHSHAEEHGDAIWDPHGIVRTYRGHSWQMAERHVDAALASALLFAAAVPPLGFNGDLRGLGEKDFDEGVVRAVKRQRLTEAEKEGWTRAEEDRWVEGERRAHEEGVGLLAARKGPAERFYGEVEKVRLVAVETKRRETGEAGGGGCSDVVMGGN